MKRNLIISDPAIMMGKPIVAGTRITVEHILEEFAAGRTVQDLLQAHPRLNKNAVFAAFDFAARALKADVIYPIAESAR